MCEYEFEREFRECPQCGNKYRYYDDELGEERIMSPVYRWYEIDFSLIGDDKTQEIFDEIKRSWDYIKRNYPKAIVFDGLKGVETAPSRLILESYHIGYARILKILQVNDCVAAITYENILEPALLSQFLKCYFDLYGTTAFSSSGRHCATY